MMFFCHQQCVNIDVLYNLDLNSYNDVENYKVESLIMEERFRTHSLSHMILEKKKLTLQK